MDMGRFCRKVLALLVSTALAFSMVSATALTAFADGLAAGRADLPRAAAPMSSQIGTTTWTLDADGTLTIAPTNGNSGTLPETADYDGTIDDSEMEQAKGYEEAEGWRSEYKQAKSLVFQGEIAFPSLSKNAFEGFSIESVSSSAGSTVSFAAAANCRDLFKGCRSLEDISSLEHWNMSSVKYMYDIFRGCTSLSDISPLSGWDLSSAENISGMFWGCTSLSDISPLTGWDMPSVRDMGCMFNECTLLSDISPLSGWVTSSVSEDTDEIFAVTDMGSMFRGCTSLSDISPLAGWDVAYTSNMFAMFEGCTSLSDVSPLSEWDVSSVYDMAQMFYECTSLADISPLAGWKVSPNADMHNLFADCPSLSDISPLATWNAMHWSPGSPCLYAFFDTPITKFVLTSEGYMSQIKYWGKSVWNPTGGKYTGKWVSTDAVNKGPLTMAQLMEGWDPATMSGTWVAEEGEGPTGAPAAVDLSQATVSVAGATYTGSALTPAVTVRCGGAVLRPGTDYAVAYRNNVNAGTGTVTVTGKGGYAGTKVAMFSIAPADLSKAKLTGLVSKAYTGRALKQVPTVKLGSLTLKNGRDFAVSYKNNKKVGTATVTVTGKGNYAGSKSAKFKIVKNKQPMTVKAAKKTVTVKAKTLKKKAVTLARPVTVKKAKGAVTYANASTAKAAKAFKVNAKSGKVTVPKGVKKGTYALKLKVAAKGSGIYAYGEKTVTVKVKVR